MRTAELVKKVKRLQIRSRRLADALAQGQYRAAFRGSGAEFEEVREYAPGDEVKNIDWKVTARLGRPYVKLFREERELSVVLAVDVSASGLFGTGPTLLREQAAEMAALLAVSALRNGDKIGLLLFSDRVELYLPPKKGPAHAWRAVREILGHEPRGRGTDISLAARFLSKALRRRGVAVLLSDFLDEGYAPDLRRLAARHDLIAALVSDPGAGVLPEAGLTTARDPETGRTVLLDCFDPTTRREWERERLREAAARRTGLIAAGADVLERAPDTAAATALRAFFRRRERRRR